MVTELRKSHERIQILDEQVAASKAHTERLRKILHEQLADRLKEICEESRQTRESTERGARTSDHRFKL